MPRKTPEERREYMRQYYHTHKEKWKEIQDRYKEKHKEEIAERLKQYRLDNPEKDKEYYSKNRNAILEKQKKWVENNQEKVRGYKKKYKQVHREEVLKKGREYAAKVQAEHPEILAARRKKSYNSKHGLAASKYRAYRRIDKGKGFPIDNLVTPEWIEANIFSGQTCIYCGESDWHKLGTDRIDNSKGHTPDNCVPCCASCNGKRKDKPFLEFLSKSEAPTAKVLYSMHMIENAKRLALASLLD